MTAYEKVKAARDPARPTATDYINSIFAAFTEMHGDRRYSDDGAVVTGLALLGLDAGDGHRGWKRGTTSRSASPATSAAPTRRATARRCADEAGRKVPPPDRLLRRHLGRILRHRRGGARTGAAIAENLYEMSALKTPILSVFIGEGGSGGALGLAVADEVWMTENAVYSVISPEGCASILWKDPAKVADAAECLKMTAADLYELGVVDRILLETGGDSVVFSTLKVLLARKLRALCAVEPDELVRARYNRFRAFGDFLTL